MCVSLAEEEKGPYSSISFTAVPKLKFSLICMGKKC